MLLNTYEPWKFAFSKEIVNLDEIQKDSWGIIGVPFDSTSSYHTGSRLGPITIREASFGFENFNSVFKKNINSPFYDFGDLNTIPGNCLKTCEILEETVNELNFYNIKPLIIGGEHSITYGSIKGVLNSYDNLTVIHLDAHMDLKDDFIDEKFSHATVLRRVHELDIDELIQIGIRSFSKEEENYSISNNNISSFSVENIKNSLDKINKIKTPIYLTIDLDVLDPSFAPNVSNPTPCGISPNDTELIFKELVGKNLVGFDLVENSSNKLGDITAITSSKIIYDFLTLF
ncbi:MAG: agmatinase [Methanobacteriaceae archaeon]|jgi:agmatinase|nr:agmatinase [Methanobacteriaceae archaeon]